MGVTTSKTLYSVCISQLSKTSLSLSFSLHSTFYLCVLFEPLAKKCAPSFFSFLVFNSCFYFYFYFYDLGISHFSQCLTCVCVWLLRNPGKKIKEFLFLFSSLIYLVLILLKWNYHANLKTTMLNLVESWVYGFSLFGFYF